LQALAGIRSGLKAMRSFGLSPKFSTPVEKTVEIPQIRCAAGLTAHLYEDFSPGEGDSALYFRPSTRLTATRRPEYRPLTLAKTPDCAPK
jgi:hypothetical protein